MHRAGVAVMSVLSIQVTIDCCPADARDEQSSEYSEIITIELDRAGIGWTAFDLRGHDKSVSKIESGLMELLRSMRSKGDV